jgi:hypothetical protein
MGIVSIITVIRNVTDTKGKARPLVLPFLPPKGGMLRPRQEAKFPYHLESILSIGPQAAKPLLGLYTHVRNGDLAVYHYRQMADGRLMPMEAPETWADDTASPSTSPGTTRAVAQAPQVATPPAPSPSPARAARPQLCSKHGGNRVNEAVNRLRKFQCPKCAAAAAALPPQSAAATAPAQPEAAPPVEPEETPFEQEPEAAPPVEPAPQDPPVEIPGSSAVFEDAETEPSAAPPPLQHKGKKSKGKGKKSYTPPLSMSPAVSSPQADEVDIGASSGIVEDPLAKPTLPSSVLVSEEVDIESPEILQ